MVDVQVIDKLGAFPGGKVSRWRTLRAFMLGQLSKRECKEAVRAGKGSQPKKHGRANHVPRKRHARYPR